MVEKIKFGLLSPDEIRKMSAARIITADTYDEDGLPIPSGLMDQRLGTIEPGQRCQTCIIMMQNMLKRCQMLLIYTTTTIHIFQITATCIFHGQMKIVFLNGEPLTSQT